MDDKTAASTSSHTEESDVIPPPHPSRSRTLVLCFDGTGDSFDADNSNVVQFFSMLKKDDRTEQMVYYQAGIGTYTTPQIATPMMAKLSKTLDMMIAWNMDAHVMDGYEFLMQTYTSGDKICIFGFSRGAYTARALAGMIHKVGLLPAFNHQQVPFAYKMFTREDEIGWKQSTAFKKAFSMDVDIEFIGVWDTVNSVGLIPHRLPFTSSNSSIKTFRHAVSLDEHRAKFKANLYNRPTKKDTEFGTKAGEMPKSTITTVPVVNGEKPKESEKGNDGATKKKGKGRRNPYRRFEDEFDATETVSHDTDVLEVWFSGCHCDVGGGSVDNSSRHNLARIPLRWMIRQCFLTNSGIRFHAPLIAAVGLDPASLYPIVKPRPAALFYATPPSIVTDDAPASPTSTTHLKDTAKTLVNYADVTTNGTSAGAMTMGYSNVAIDDIMTEEEEDLKDALCPIYDQLRIAPYWWVLELLPMRLRSQREDNNEWVKEFTVNFGRGREIPRQKRLGVKVHRSVKIRMDAGENAAGGKYAPRAKWKVEPTWVD